MSKTNVFSSIAAAALLGAASLAVSACSQASANQSEPPAPPVVTVAQPLRQPVDQWSEHTGRFAPAQSVEVRPRVSGYLEAVHFVDGQQVKKGQLLFTLDPRPFQAEVDRRQAELAQAQAQLSLAESEFARAQSLRTLDAISEQEFDSRREAVARARAARQAAQAAVRAASLDLGYTKVHAPISGRISDRRVHAGNLVQSGQSVLTSIVALDPIHFEFSAAEGLLNGAGGPRLTGGQEVALRLEGEDDFVHLGRTDFLDNRIDPGTGTIRGRAVFANPDGRFTPGQFGRLRVLTPNPAPAVLVPESAVNSDQSRKYVLVVNEENIVEYRPVVLGPAINGLRVVEEGLSGSEKVVVNGLQRAIPGTPVTPEAGRIQAAVTTFTKAG